jgi:hypothetical protein
MYLTSVILLLLVFPGASIAAEALVFSDATFRLALIARWFVFWAVGVCLFIAGLRQVFQPRFTAESIFEIKDPGTFGVVREVGFGNLSMGTLGIASLAYAGWVVPAAIVGGLYYGLAGSATPRVAVETPANGSR